MALRDKRVAIIGAGMGGLAAALALAARGVEVVLLEAAATPGGKMRQLRAGTALIDAGPTVFTMRFVFDELLAEAGTTLDAELGLSRAGILARHAWPDGSRLDLHADLDASEAAIRDFAGAAEAQGFRAFAARAARIWRTLETPFIRAAAASPLSLVRAAGVSDMMGISPFTTLWRALGEHFRDARLRQLFGRYATYCGASPFAAPATLMLVAHVEQEGVWLVDGGMQALAAMLARLAASKGASLRFGSPVAAIDVERGRARSVLLASGERIEADAVILNADVAALASGLFGREAARAAETVPVAQRSLSAITWAIHAETSGFPLLRHNVIFSGDYKREFDELGAGRLPSDPTIYVCAQDRGDTPDAGGAERLLVLVNAPALGDRDAPDAASLARCETATFTALARAGLRIDRDASQAVLTTPKEFNALLPATGGALYGRASHGWTASFKRPGIRTKIPGLYLAGGSVHPGPGVPMAALSGRAAASCAIEDFAST